MRAVAALVLVGLAACRSQGAGPYEPPEAVERSTVLAERLSREAAEVMAEDPERAEQLLRRALSADLFFGPAHNNLGVVFLKQGKRYEAATEFEWARKLMPGHPDPRVNLAMTLEEAGKVDDALASYTAALEVYPGYLPAVQGVARATLRAGRSHEDLRGWLEAIAERSDDPAWRDWARGQLVRE